MLILMAGFVGAAEIARILGVSRQRVHELRRTHADFPDPLATLSQGAIWDRDEIQNWASHRDRRPGRKSEARRRLEAIGEWKAHETRLRRRNPTPGRHIS
jgi:predicted DNA-binding transcriptional regulator AlpA